MIERTFQADAVQASLDAYDAGVRKQLLVMATGTGKTHCFGRLYEAAKSRLSGQMMIIAHTDELVRQNLLRMQEWVQRRLTHLRPLSVPAYRR